MPERFPKGSVMAGFERFEQLDDPDFFCTMVIDHYERAWDEVVSSVGMVPTVDRDRAKFAFETYHNNLREVKIRLQSGNPDHYKRAACLLDALHRAELIQDLQYDQTTYSALEDGTAFGLSYDDCQYRLKFIRYYGENANALMAWDLSFRCCAVYEHGTRPYNPNYLECIVHYLHDHTNQNIASLFIIFKSYWFPRPAGEGA